MKHFLFKLVTILSTLGMVLPTGWCCVTLGQVQASAKPAKACCQRPCCQHRQPVERCDTGHVPCNPNLRCCCERVSALPTKRLKKSVAPIVALPTPVFDLASARPWALSWAPENVPPAEGPPINLLQCVWRC